MSALLNEKGTETRQPLNRNLYPLIDPPRGRGRPRKRPIDVVSSHDEMAFVAGSVITMAALGVAPLLVYLVFYYSRLWF